MDEIGGIRGKASVLRYRFGLGPPRRACNRSALAARSCSAVATPRVSRPSMKVAVRKPVGINQAPTVASRSVVTAVGVEIASVAGEAGFIAGTAAVMFGITLVGLAVGFVLLRVETLAEEGKL
eukprot:gene17138-23442_t